VPGTGGIGLLGGTFDPVHLGHLAVARQVAAALALSSVYLVPSNRPPHRRAPAAPPADRLAMARIATADEAGIGVLDVELGRGGVSYTVDTLRELRDRWPGEALVLLLGWDAARLFSTWKEPQAIAELCALAVFNRAGESQPAAADLEAAGLPPATRLLAVESPDISATAVRRRLATGGDVSSMVPPGVLAYIRKRHLYGA